MIVFIDTETHRFGPANMAPRVVCLSYCFENTGAKGVIGRDEIPDFFLDLFAKGGPSPRFVGHRIAYDFACIISDWPELTDHVFNAYNSERVLCTKVREKLINIARGEHKWKRNGKPALYSLTNLTEDYLGIKLDKGADGWRLRYAELEETPIEEWPRRAYEYALNDAIEGLAVYRKQEERIKEIPIPTQYAETAADFASNLMSVWGFQTDPHHIKTLSAKYDYRMKVIAEWLVKEGLLVRKFKTKPGYRKSQSAIRARFVKAVDNPKLTEKGAVSIAAEELAKAGDPLLDQLVEYTHLEKLKSTYLDKLTPTVHANFDMLGTESSRSSCKNPNLQNLPREVGLRECYTARPGKVLISCDYSSQELRTLAQACIDTVGFSRLAERYQRDPDFDPHLDFAARILGKPLETLDPKDPETKEARQQAKACNFGFPGGMGIKRFRDHAEKAYGIAMTEDHAKRLRDQWLEQWPEMGDYFARIANLTQHGSADIVIKRSGFVRGDCAYCDAANTQFQTLAAHASKLALWNVTREMYGREPRSYLWGCRAVAFVHDEIIIEAPEAYAPEAAERLAEVMVESMEKLTPDVPSRAEPSLMERWSKNAEPAFDKEGRLIPWTD